MESVGECVVCGAGISTSRKAAIAPFLARRIWNREAFRVELVECRDCGFKFFNPRLTREEEVRLYAGYRDGQYQQERHSFEPWYTEAFNRGLSGPEAWRKRKGRLAQILGQPLSGFDIRRVLDFGGATGELVADLMPHAEPYVYDISGLQPVSRVTKLSSLSECRAHRFDLIVCSNVLEHVSFPRRVLRQIDEIASPGTLIFIEVPCESPFHWRSRAKRIAQATVLAFVRPKLAWSLLRLHTLNLMHEHVNYFSFRSLERLIRLSNWCGIGAGMYRVSDFPTADEMAWSLVRVAHKEAKLTSSGTQ